MRTSSKYFLLLLVILAAKAMAGEKPGFNCEAKNLNITESAICSDKRVAILDGGITHLYKSIFANEADKANLNTLKATQRSWIKKRNDCLDSIDCIIAEYNRRFAELEKNGKELSDRLTLSNAIKDPALLIGFADGGDELAWRGLAHHPDCSKFADLNWDGRSELQCVAGCYAQLCPKELFLSTKDGYEKLNTDFTDRSIFSVPSKIPVEISKKYSVQNSRINGWSVMMASVWQDMCSDSEDFYVYDGKSYKVAFSRSTRRDDSLKCP